MAKFKVTAPAEGYAGMVGKVQFAAGVAEIDEDANPAELSYCRSAGYLVEPVEQENAEPEPKSENDGPFDPAEHDMPAVLAYLEAATYDEAERVLQAESDGKARKGILNTGGPLLAAKQGEEK